jgi:hypothetical protein
MALVRRRIARAHLRERLLEQRELLVGHRVRVLLLGERPVADLAGVPLDRRANRRCKIGVLLDEARRMAFVEAEQVVPHEHLTVAVRAGADPDRRDVERRCDPRGDR